MTIKLISAFILAFLFATAFGKFYIPWLRKQKAGQEIKENGPTWHMAKTGTNGHHVDLLRPAKAPATPPRVFVIVLPL